MLKCSHFQFPTPGSHFIKLNYGKLPLNREAKLQACFRHVTGPTATAERVPTDPRLYASLGAADVTSYKKNKSMV
jgi:hypothetical protein